MLSDDERKKRDKEEANDVVDDKDSLHDTRLKLLKFVVPSSQGSSNSTNSVRSTVNEIIGTLCSEGSTESSKLEAKSNSISPQPMATTIFCSEDKENCEQTHEQGGGYSTNDESNSEKRGNESNSKGNVGKNKCDINDKRNVSNNSIGGSGGTANGADRAEMGSKSGGNSADDDEDDSVKFNSKDTTNKDYDETKEEELSSDYFRRMARGQSKKASTVNLTGYSFGLNFSQKRGNGEASKPTSVQSKLPPLIDHRKRTRREHDEDDNEFNSDIGNNAFKKLFAGAKKNTNNKHANKKGFTKSRGGGNKRRYSDYHDDDDDKDERYKNEEQPRPKHEIVTALDYLLEQSRETRLKNGLDKNDLSQSYGANRQKSLGISRSATTQPFRPPVSANNGNSYRPDGNIMSTEVSSSNQQGDDWLRKLDPRLVETIENEIMETANNLHWDDIAGLSFVKRTIEQIVVMPMLRPDIFKGLRAPPKGLLLFGPPGTGKTLIGKCIASQSGSTFFLISASSLTSKWVGEGEKLVRALFTLARARSPSVIFIDEIDSLLSARNDSDIDSTRKMKTEFLVQLDGANVAKEERLLIVGATNRPQDLDEAVRRRLQKRLYVPLPDELARAQIIERLMMKERHTLSTEDYASVASDTSGYSGADVAQLCQEAALGPLQTLSASDIVNISPEEVRPINLQDFQQALQTVKASVADADLAGYSEWNQKFGAGR